MDHPFEHRAHYNAEGKACHCPWGWDKGGEHLGSVKESSKLDWLKSRPDLQDGDGQWLLNWLDHPDEQGNRFADADKLLPWLVREWKKHRLEPRGSIDKSLEWQYPNGDVEQLKIPQAVEAQQSLEEMQKRHQGVDVMQHKIHELMPKIQDFQDWKKAQSRENLGEILHRFPDGWTVRHLNTPEEFADEGEEMGHCLGDEEGYGHHHRSDDGSRIFLSLRDHKNLPHATMELSPSHWQRGDEISQNRGVGAPGHPSEWKPQIGSNSAIKQFYGKEDNYPLPEYQNRMSEWLEPKGVSMEWEENPEAGLWQENHDPVMASTTKPLYYRWVYSPSKGVTLNSNQDDHPALVKYHTGLSGDINDTDLSHGYASHIGGGWRITDLEHQPVDDPYIVQQVVRRLNHEEGPEIRSEGSWQPSEFNWDRLHYGIPCEKVGTT